MLEQRLADGVGAPADDALIFTSSWGTPMDPRNWGRELRQRGLEAGIEGVHPHLLRHTAVALLLNAGETMSIISKMIGHQSERTTSDIYAHLSSEGRHRVADAMEAILGGS